MYPIHETMNNRLPKAQPASQAPANSLGRTVGTAVAQAAAIVIIAKLVDVLFESFMSRRRAQQAHAPQSGRREEVVA